MWRIDAYEKVTGRTKFTFDMTLHRMLYAKILRSSRAHAMIVRIDTRNAEKHRGVKAVLTHKDVPNIPYNPIFNAPDPKLNLIARDRRIFEPVVRYVGDPVAAVAADSLESAEAALDLIEVDYEDLPAVFDPIEAMKPEAPKIHPNAEGNIAPGWRETGRPITIGVGDIDRGFSEADQVFSDIYRTQRQHQFAMEPHTCISNMDSGGRLHVWSSTQSMFMLRSTMAQALNIAPSNICVHKMPLGGAFGSKLDMGDHETICGLFALRTGQPVKLTYTRREEFIATSRHASILELKTGVKRDGTLTARYCKMILDCGAHASHGPSVAVVGGMYFDAAYRCPNRLFEALAVYTNKFPSGAMRGYGGVQVAFAVESQMEEIARQLGLDPIAIRIRNFYRVGDVSPRTGYTINSCGIEEAVSKASEAFGFYQPKSPPSAPHKRRGRGVAFQTIRGTGTGARETAEKIVEYSGAIVKLNEDGSVNLLTATVDVGGGQGTVLTRIVSEELGVRPEDVKLVGADTDTAPFDAPTHASRVTYVSGYAAKVAAAHAKVKLLEIAASLLQVSPDHIEVRDGMVHVVGDPRRSLSVTEVAWFAYFHLQTTIIGSSSIQPPDNPPPFGVQFVEVEVDTETGEVQVLRAVSAHDVGRAIFHPGIEGQVHGGVAQGIGYALTEQIIHSGDNGDVLNADLKDYRIPTTVEVPRSLVFLVQTTEPSGIGAKSISEAALHAPAPALANAIYDAIGIRVKELPATPNRILAALKQLRADSPGSRHRS